MSPLDIIRAWKDEDYRLSFSNAPESPVGLIELTDADMGLLAGGGGKDCCECEDNCKPDNNKSGKAKYKECPPPGCSK